VNEISTSGAFAKIFFYREISGNSVIEEITQDGGSIIFDDYDLLSDVKIILGTDTAQPKVTAFSPIPNEIFGLDDSLFIVLDMENPHEIGILNFIFEVDGILDTISISDDEGHWQSEGEYAEQFPVYIHSSKYDAFLNTAIAGDFSDSVNIFIEIIDRAGNSGAGNGYESEQVGPLTFSRDVSNISLNSGWHLLSSPLAGDDGENIFDNLFYFPAYDCSDGCDEFDPFETATSGTGFYVKSNGDNATTFTGDVLSESSSALKQGWNLIGNPLVTPIDVNSLLITYENMGYMDLTWQEASDSLGIISPTPIIYDNENGGHIGASELSAATGFWVHSFYDDVEISFIPSNPSLINEVSSYWNLSLFVKENNTGTNYDESIGSEIVIGIDEDAKDYFVDGEDQEIIFPLSGMNIFDHYSELSINNDSQTSLYRDIRDYHDTSITWDLNLEGQYFYDNGVLFSWKFSGDEEPYDYYLNIGENSINMKGEMLSTVVESINLSEDMSITAVLKDEYIGCTNPLADNPNEMANGISDPNTCEYEGGVWEEEGDYCKCANEFCLGGNDADYCDILSLLLPEETLPLDYDEAFDDLPIELVNPLGTPIEGLQFVLEYDAALVQLIDGSLDDSLNGYDILMSFEEPCDDCILSKLSVTIYNITASDELFSGEGKIMTLSGVAVGGGLTTISFSSVQINENSAFGNSSDIMIGINYVTVSGKLNYYKNVVPISDGLISITGFNDTLTTNSNGSGNFIVDQVIAGAEHELIISKDEYGGNIDDYFDGLSAVDASRIARHAANLYNFSPDEKIAANVIIDYRCENGYGEPIDQNESECSYNWVPNIEAGDASRVARYAAGIIEDLDDQCDPHWIFLNDENDEIMIDDVNCEYLPNFSKFVRNYKIVDLNSDADLTFTGIRLGDVTGNWTASLSRENDENIVESPIVELEVGQILQLPLYLPNKVEIEGVDLTIQYDPEVFTLIGFNNSNSILDKSKYPTIINTEKRGVFTLVSYANSTPINDNGLLGHIKFKVIGNSTPWSSISINEMKINDIQKGGFLVEGDFESSSITYGFDFQISAVPEVFALNKNYPNPFNPSTNINFELPNDGDVRIFIYDLKGSLIDELVNGYMEAGYYNLKWDGSRKSSGVYFIQMIADNGNYIKMTKMMLVK
jgi:hypothetical protein